MLTDPLTYSTVSVSFCSGATALSPGRQNCPQKNYSIEDSNKKTFNPVLIWPDSIMTPHAMAISGPFNQPAFT
jgi:hypothetical protein